MCGTRAPDPDPHTPDPVIPESIAEVIAKPRKKAASTLEPLPISPDWLPAETWQAFIDHRRVKRAALTASSAAMTLKQLDKARGFGHDPVVLIETAIASNWIGCVFPERHFCPAASPRSSSVSSAPSAASKHNRIAAQNAAALEEWLSSRVSQANVIEGECYEIH